MTATPRIRTPQTVADPCTPAEIADRLELGRNTVRQWIHRGHLGAPDWTPAGTNLWDWNRLVELDRVRARITDLELEAATTLAILEDGPHR